MGEIDLEWAPIHARICNIPASLTSGQTFRWRFREGSPKVACLGAEWLGVIADSAVRLRPSVDGFYWQTYPVAGRWNLIEEYFALDVDLEALYEGWVRSEPRIQPAIEQFSGLRVLRQEADEVFFSFLCASCNTIVKITRTIQALEQRAGELVAQVEGESLYRFPTAEAIASIPESELRSDLWGYRAPRVIQLAGYLAAQPPGWLDTLRRIPYRDAHEELAAMFGIGAKLADCICLFGLGHDEAVPVDTHIRQIATRLFRPDLAQKSLTPTVYRAIGDLIREKFPTKPGWAQQYLFMQSLNA